MEEKYELKSFILSSKNRLKVLGLLEKVDEPIYPAKIADELNLQRSSISRTLSDLKEKELVECLNPNSKKFKFFRITDKGKKTLSLIE